MSAHRGNVVHLPRPRLIAIAAAGERAHRAHVDAHPTLLAVEPASLSVRGKAIRRNHRRDAAILDAQREHVHALAAHAHAAVAKNAARTVKVDSRRPLLLIAVLLGLGVEALARAVLEGHILQFALAASVAYRAIERVVAEQQLNGCLARLRDLSRLGNENLSLGDSRRAGRLQLTHFFLAHHAHAAGGLQAQARIVAESRNLDARLAASLNQQRPRGSRQRFSIDCESYVCHFFLCGTNRAAVLPVRRNLHFKLPDYEVIDIFKIFSFEINAHRHRFWNRIAILQNPLQVKFESLAHHCVHFIECVTDGDTTGHIGSVAREVAAFAFCVNNQIALRHFNPACLRIL